MTIKKISATITNQRDGPDEPASLERSSSIRSEISDIDRHIPPTDARRIQEEVQEMRDRDSGEVGLNPILNSQGETQEVTTLSEIYIDDKNLTNWSKKHLTAHEFRTEPFPIRTLSDNNRYEVKRFYEYIPEEVLNNKNTNKNF